LRGEGGETFGYFEDYEGFVLVAMNAIWIDERILIIEHLKIKKWNLPMRRGISYAEERSFWLVSKYDPRSEYTN